MTIFWSVLALLYLSLAVVTQRMSKPIKEKLKLLSQEDALTSDSPKYGEVGLESTLYKAYRSILITDVVGLILAATAAVGAVVLDCF